MDSTFDPGAAAPQDSGIFGLPHSPAEAKVHVVPVPFDATTSYRKGAANGPDAVLRASRQVDLFDLLTGRPYAAGIAMLEADPEIAAWNAEASTLAQPILDAGGDLSGSAALARDLARVNAIGELLNERVEALVGASMNEGKLVAVLGGDHAVPYGAIRAASKRFPGLGVLHFDAHADLRQAFEGFTWSHASILRNVMERIPAVARLVQVGLRDLSEEEHDFIAASNGRIRALTDPEWAFARAEGQNLRALVRRTLEPLPENVWISFDVDGLDPALCPNTGTPVPGGFTFNEAMLWLDELARSGRRIVGLDLNEVSPGDRGDAADAADDIDSFDAVVGARLLYRLIGFALLTS